MCYNTHYVITGNIPTYYFIIWYPPPDNDTPHRFGPSHARTLSCRTLSEPSYHNQLPFPPSFPDGNFFLHVLLAAVLFNMISCTRVTDQKHDLRLLNRVHRREKQNDKNKIVPRSRSKHNRRDIYYLINVFVVFIRRPILDGRRSTSMCLYR